MKTILSIVAIMLAFAAWIFPNPLNKQHKEEGVKSLKISSKKKGSTIKTKKEADSQALDKYWIKEGESFYIDLAKSSISVAFQKLDNEPFITLSIFPDGGNMIPKVVLGHTASFPFESNNKTYFLNVLNVKSDSKSIEISVTIKRI